MSKVAVAQLNNEGWKSWQIALAIGVPAVVVGAYAYRKYSKKSSPIAEISEGKVSKVNKTLLLEIKLLENGIGCAL